MEMTLAKKAAVSALTLFALLVCLSLSAQAQRKMPPLDRFAAPLVPAGPDCTTVAGNLVANCGFETGDLTGWAVSDPLNIFVDNSTPNNGTYSVNMGSIGAVGCISQTLATNAGQVYFLSLALTNVARPNNFQVFFGATEVSGDMLNMPDFPYVQFSMTVTAAGTDTLMFCAENDLNYFNLDDIIVR